MNFNNKEFISEFGYKIFLPENWAEYEDEKNTNAFFDTIEWTGNLRISSIQIDQKKGDELLESEMKSFEGRAEKLKTQNGFNGIKYSDEDELNFITYWLLIVNDKMFICSFTINITEKETQKSKLELVKVNKIIDSLQP
ncbi:DUF3805 domain-containing protein [Flavobacterium sp. KJJ]|uniref:DUF3805 domain-containing protein n=1 Tax=Flavobacterium sp. KJJ TaxID=1270193 RepID=UPI0004936519|nr:DUF3805 domain-containing protein [Flavobacterium sp. KJJ]